MEGYKTLAEIGVRGFIEKHYTVKKISKVVNERTILHDSFNRLVIVEHEGKKYFKTSIGESGTDFIPFEDVNIKVTQHVRIVEGVVMYLPIINIIKITIALAKLPQKGLCSIRIKIVDGELNYFKSNAESVKGFKLTYEGERYD